jgi:hypothetical protein
MLVLIIVEGVVILMLAVLVIGLLRSHAEILRRLHELGAGAYDEREPSGQSPVEFTPAPGVPAPRDNETPAVDLSGLSPSGSTVAVGVRDTDHSTLLAFLSSGCLTCQSFWDAFQREDLTDLPGRQTRLVVVTKGNEAESPASIADLAPKGITTLMSSEAWQQYDVPVSPYFILVDGPSSAVIGEGAAASWTQVRDLLERACADIGLTTEARPRGHSGADRADRIDAELRAAGLAPGDPALYQSSIRSEGDDGS